MDNETKAAIRDCMESETFRNYIRTGRRNSAFAYATGYLRNVPELFELLYTILQAEAEY